jgi:hypothetical protein
MPQSCFYLLVSGAFYALTVTSVKNYKKRKHTSLSINDRLKIIEKLQACVLVAKGCGEFRVAKQAGSDVKKNKSKVKQSALKSDVGLSTRESVPHRKNIKLPKIKTWKK